MPVVIELIESGRAQGSAGTLKGRNMAENEIPRRARMDHWIPAERAIYDAKQAVESVGAHLFLTQAVILLGRAQDKVADFVDGYEPKAEGSIHDELESARNRAAYATEGAAHFASCRTCAEDGYQACEVGELYATGLGLVAAE
jgi:hypothetical protein